MTYTTYEIHVCDTVADLVAVANTVLDELGLGATRIESLEQGWAANMDIGDPPQRVRLLVEAQPNQLFCRILEEAYGMVPVGSIGIDTEHEDYEGCQPIGLLLKAVLRVTNSDVVVTLNDGPEGTIEVFRRSNMEPSFAPWLHGAAFKDIVLDR